MLWLCSTYDCWPALDVVLMAWSMVALSFGAFYFVESYLLLRGARHVRHLPQLPLRQHREHARPVAAMGARIDRQRSPERSRRRFASTMAICGSIITNLVFTTMAAVGRSGGRRDASGIHRRRSHEIRGPRRYSEEPSANFAIKYPKVAVFSLGLPLAV